MGHLWNSGFLQLIRNDLHFYLHGVQNIATLTKYLSEFVRSDSGNITGYE